MKRVCLLFAVIVAAGLAFAARADASVFCPADISYVMPLGTTQYAYALDANDTSPLSGDIVVVTADKAYRIPFSNVAFTGNLKAGYASDAGFFSLPENGQVQYAWVDDITDAKGKRADCPTFPQPVLSVTMSGSKGDAAALARALQSSTRAQFLMDLTAPQCATPYRHVEPIGTLPQTTDFFDPSIVNKPTLEGAVYVDSNGNVVDVKITKSSGSIAFDTDAKNMYGGRRYAPEIFQCTPVVSVYRFQVQYYRN
jgi:hypothetical protein